MRYQALWPLLGIFETAIAMTIYYFILVILGLVAAIFLHAKRYLHVTFRLFIVSLVIQFIYFVFYLSEYAQFSSSGIFTPGMLTTGQLGHQSYTENIDYAAIANRVYACLYRLRTGTVVLPLPYCNRTATVP